MGYTFSDLGGCNCTPAVCPCPLPQQDLAASLQELGGATYSGTLTYNAGAVYPNPMWAGNLAGGSTYATVQIGFGVMGDIGPVWETAFWLFLTSSDVDWGFYMCPHSSAADEWLFANWAAAHPGTTQNYFGPSAVGPTNTCSPLNVVIEYNGFTLTITP